MHMHARAWSGHAGRVIVVVAIVLSGRAESGEEAASSRPDARELRFFEQSVRPLLADKCYSCHGPTKQKGGLRLDSLEAILKGGESGPALVPGKPDESLLVEAVKYAGPEMPPTGKLPDERIAELSRWVSHGAAWPRSAGHATVDAIAAKSSPSRAEPPLWSLKPMANPDPPPILTPDGAAWARNPIDAFILKGLHEHGLTPAPEADRATLIRRLAFDLTGLPPTANEIEAFLADPAPDAYDRLVDRLLASPRYGERWGRHWLDLVRYAESDGFRQDAYRPRAWRYRDYVVRSFNIDKPYDRFVTEQIAGDELDPDDPELRVAVGYSRLGAYEYNQRDARGQWAEILNDVTDVTGEAFMGLSVGCARCHDHKFDPILQKDYYRLQAFFTPMLPRDDLSDLAGRAWRDYEIKRGAWERAAREVLAEIARLEKPYRDRAAATAMAKFQPEIQAILGKPDSARSPLERQVGALAYRQIAYEFDHIQGALKPADKARRQALEATLGRFQRLKPAEPEPILTVTDVGPVSPPTVIPGGRGRQVVEPGYLTILDPGPARVVASREGSTGRRPALAKWLCEPENPLTTRVIVNRAWQYHLGRGLVGTASDFGRLGETPSHPELLDWLARRFLKDGRRMKSLHRLIVTSAAYRQASIRGESETPLALRIDPENRLLWKHGVTRLDAEEIRDAMLFTCGELENRMGGPSVPASQPRRSIDTQVVRNAQDPLLDAFDAPNGNVTAARRDSTTTPTQALLLLNGSWSLQRAGVLARRIEQAASANREVAALAYRLILGRHPEPDEQERVLRFLAHPRDGSVPTGGQAANRQALIDLCHVLLNSNEFVYVD